jgi:2-polyprenyl-3-methyl-5-hydroxy-6-metoxy-1,4-benzoquinol methylase
MFAGTLDETDAAALARYLLSFRWPFRHDDVEQELVAGGLPLWQEILRVVPETSERRSALELGSPPFHITLLLQRFRRYDLTLSGAASDDRPEIVQDVESPDYDERHHFRCLCFDVERDRFPFDDGTFDLVTCCEVIEHLMQNPVHALAEIHRVLRPGGWFVLSTPNAARAGNISNLLRGGNVYDPYHLGTALRGSRHSREYTLDELRDLIGGCGFEIDLAQNVDLRHPVSLTQRAFRTLLYHVVAPLTGAHYRAHLLVRARRTEAPFRWHYPSTLVRWSASRLPRHAHEPRGDDRHERARAPLDRLERNATRRGRSAGAARSAGRRPVPARMRAGARGRVDAVVRARRGRGMARRRRRLRAARLGVLRRACRRVARALDPARRGKPAGHAAPRAAARERGRRSARGRRPMIAGESSAPYASPRVVTDLADCIFYHSMDLPEHGTVHGLVDLRGGVDEYLGGVDLHGKRVLEMGTADGFLCFEMERRGADVVAYDLSEAQHWDFVPRRADMPTN